MPLPMPSLVSATRLQPFWCIFGLNLSFGRFPLIYRGFLRGARVENEFNSIDDVCFIGRFRTGVW